MHQSDGQMVARYNTFQILAGIGSSVGSLIGYGAAWLFFRYMPAFVAHGFSIQLSALAFDALAIVILIAITLSGYRQWKKRGGFYGYHESSLYHDLGEDTAGALVVDFYAHRVTGPAYMLSQLFLAGPLLALRAITHFRNLIPAQPGLDERLGAVLERLRKLNKWQGLPDHPDVRQEIFLLAKMDLIDFSVAKGSPRFKAEPESA
jgi:hypothetical protein